MLYKHLMEIPPLQTLGALNWIHIQTRSPFNLRPTARFPKWTSLNMSRGSPCGLGGSQVNKFELVHMGQIGTPWTDGQIHMTENITLQGILDPPLSVLYSSSNQCVLTVVETIELWGRSSVQCCTSTWWKFLLYKCLVCLIEFISKQEVLSI